MANFRNNVQDENHVAAEAQKVMHADTQMGTTHDSSVIHIHRVLRD